MPVHLATVVGHVWTVSTTTHARVRNDTTDHSASSFVKVRQSHRRHPHHGGMLIYLSVCSGSVVVTAYDFESGGPGSSPEWGQYTMRLRSLHWAYPSLHPFGVVHWVPEQLNINAVTGACKLIDGCSLELCLATPPVHGIIWHVM